MESVAGIREVGDAGRTIRITPHLAKLKTLDVRYPTPCGILKVCCRTDEKGETFFEYEAPEGLQVICE